MMKLASNLVSSVALQSLENMIWKMSSEIKHKKEFEHEIQGYN